MQAHGTQKLIKWVKSDVESDFEVENMLFLCRDPKN